MKLVIVTTPEQDEVIAKLNSQVNGGKTTDEEYATSVLTEKVDGTFESIASESARVVVANLMDKFYTLSLQDQATVIEIVNKLGG